MWKPRGLSKRPVGKSLAAHLELKIINRDQGICVKCGTDTTTLYEAMAYVFSKCEHGGQWEWWPLDFSAFKHALGARAAKFPKRLFEIDHIIPREEGGTDAMKNLQTLCNLCHLRKHGRTKTLVQIPLE